MGSKSREIVKANIEELLNDLTAAYSDEWLAHYQYWLMSMRVRGIDADALRSVLEEQSQDELGHARKIADRILQLGGELVMNPSALAEKAGCGYMEPPVDRADIEGVIENVLSAEACAIETYSRLAEKYRNSDIVTHELFEDLLKDEVEDEETWERFRSIPRQATGHRGTHMQKHGLV